MSSILLAACIITKIHDGDTLTAQCPKRKTAITVRVAEIDAPELKAFTWKDQPGAIEARDAARTLCLKKVATVRLQKFDARTNRWIAKVECSGVDLSQHLARNGLAWSYMPAKRSVIPNLQSQARVQGLGLWAQPGAVPPSTWRKQ